MTDLNRSSKLFTDETRAPTSRALAPARFAQTLARYLDENIASLRVSRLVRRLAAIVRLHRLLELETPLPASGCDWRDGAFSARHNRPRQALGVDRRLRDQLLAGCPDALAGRHDKALVALVLMDFAAVQNLLA